MSDLKRNTTQVVTGQLKTGTLDVGRGLGSAVLDGGLQRGVVALVLVGVFLRKLGDRLVECAEAAEVGGQRDAFAGACVRPGQGLPAQPGVAGQVAP